MIRASDIQAAQWIRDFRGLAGLPIPGSGREQLFDLENDYGELRDLSREPDRHGELEIWRNRMAKELSARRAS